MKSIREVQIRAALILSVFLGLSGCKPEFSRPVTPDTCSQIKDHLLKAPLPAYSRTPFQLTDKDEKQGLCELRFMGPSASFGELDRSKYEGPTLITVKVFEPGFSLEDAYDQYRGWAGDRKRGWYKEAESKYGPVNVLYNPMSGTACNVIIYGNDFAILQLTYWSAKAFTKEQFDAGAPLSVCGPEYIPPELERIAERITEKLQLLPDSDS
ncbi:MAG: hypothetical protein RH862_03365 [Leptospiraceae bacterium]